MELFGKLFEKVMEPVSHISDAQPGLLSNFPVGKVVKVFQVNETPVSFFQFGEQQAKKTGCFHSVEKISGRIGR
jgi:hypothetical protein